MVALRAVNALFLQTAAVLTEAPDGCSACSEHTVSTDSCCLDGSLSWLLCVQ